jgi:hypothetical protein
MYLHWAELIALEDEQQPKPGTPVSEHVRDIAARLKEIETDRLRDIQAATPPEEKN